VPGRIRDDDIALVRERARIDTIVSEHVTLRKAGGGSLKGLCPFHDEKSPSFHVTPSRGFYHCFGCGEGGDVITFVQRVEGLGFTEAVERLAARTGVQLRYTEEGPGARLRPHSGQRSRLVEAHRLAAEFYVGQLLDTPDSLPGRRFLEERGFDKDAAETFGVGFAPRTGDSLLRHLRHNGFKDDELVTAGLVAEGGRGPYDRFRGRLLWPIRDVSGEVVGFGARRLFDDDRIEAKYLNTPETPIYKKSQVLYGVDLARREIARRSQAVVVEGYTDVMACHVSGVPTAVATCGTSFGEDHARVLRRLLLDHDEFRGEIIFTFDGDEAGRRAALKAFHGDAHFVAQTYVAVEPDGLDPCELRLSKGDAGVRELVARRVPLYRFVLGNVLERYDLDRADGRVDAMREASRLVASIRDRSKVEAFARELAGMVGLDVEEVRAEVRNAVRQGAPAGRDVRRSPSDMPTPAAAVEAAQQRPHLRDPRFAVERETLKLAIQSPRLADDQMSDLELDDFVHPTYALVWQAIVAAGGVTSAAEGWVTAVRDRCVDPEASSTITALAVEPVLAGGDVTQRYAQSNIARLQELTALRRIEDVKSKLQRMNPVEQAAEYNRMFGELVALEGHRRTLRERAIGGE
jgi:DNA primase